MLPRKLIAGFLLKFALVYGLLLVPWPGWNDAYGSFLRSVGNLVFAREHGPRLLRFEAVPPASRHVLDSQILLANREMVGKNGKIPAKYLELDTRSVGWIPTGMLMALVLSTPMGWRRKAIALIWGLVAIHAFIIFSLAAYIWNNSPDLGLLAVGPFARRITEGLQETLITQMGASFVVPFLIWGFVTFRQRDLLAIGRWFSSGEDAREVHGKVAAGRPSQEA